jgi:hypothetical protein
VTAGVRIRRLVRARDALPGKAVCNDCTRFRTDVTRERARQHVKQTGRTVHYVVETTWIYEPEEGQ